MFAYGRHVMPTKFFISNISILCWIRFPLLLEKKDSFSRMEMVHVDGLVPSDNKASPELMMVTSMPTYSVNRPRWVSSWNAIPNDGRESLSDSIFKLMHRNDIFNMKCWNDSFQTQFHPLLRSVTLYSYSWWMINDRVLFHVNAFTWQFFCSCLSLY